MIWRWIYVSQSMIGGGSANAAVADVLEASARRNAALGVTGALVRGGGRFAQFLEGSEESILHLKECISRDPRHAHVTTIEYGGGHRARQFANWSLAYAGPSSFFAQILGRVELGKSQQRRPVRDDIRTVFAEFAAKPKSGGDWPPLTGGRHQAAYPFDEDNGSSN